MKIKVIGGIVLLLVLAGIGWWLFGGQPRGQLGSVSTSFRWLGPNDKIVVDGFDDPKGSRGVACHISRPERGGVSGALGNWLPADIARMIVTAVATVLTMAYLIKS